jgi:hypothetical protein
MKSQMRLLECVLADASIWCSTSTTRDFETITRRVEREGISFLTITLPTFCSDFERSLEIGCVDPSFFLGFKKKGALPVFLRGLLGLVFNASDGTLLEDVSFHAVYAIRQVCLLNKKLLLDCSEERIRRCYANFLETDRSVAEFEENLGVFLDFVPGDPRYLRDSRSDGEVTNAECESERSRSGADSSHARGVTARLGSPMELEHFRSVAGLLWGQLFDADSFRIDANKVLPRHGPGATAERISGNRKFKQLKWHRRLDHWFPASDFLIPNAGFEAELEDIQFVDPEQEEPVRVITVPKTLKGPRIIAIEPVCVQYTQQALMEILVERLEKYDLTKGKVNFTDQTVNQSLALSSSLDGRFATIDLKDASDRVSARLVSTMLATQPIFREMLFACRSTRADVPGLGIHSLSRFASMGSAMCFPIEAMVFYTIIVSAIHRAERYPLTRKSLFKVISGVRVYGDDIIVPVEYVPIVKSELEWFNLRVNSNKSFYSGKFRESCGLDAYDGIPVKPVYATRLLPTSRHNAEELISAVSLANQLYRAGYWHACQYVRDVIERFATAPYVMENSSVLGWHSYLYGYEAHSWDQHLHRWLVKGHVVSAKSPTDILDDWPALMKFFIKRGKEPYHDAKHLERYGRPLAVYTKSRWVQPY